MNAETLIVLFITSFMYTYFLVRRQHRLKIANASLEESQRQLREQAIKLQETNAWLDQQERQARSQAAVERVRAEIATMQTSDDLERITPLVWNELSTLGVPFIRCGIFIVDEPVSLLHVYLASPVGDGLTRISMPLDSHPMITRVLRQWRQKRIHIERWDRRAFVGWMRVVRVQGHAISRDQYTDVRAFTFHVVPFAQGMFYIGCLSTLSDEHLGLVTRLAEAFSAAYARYLDFVRLEEQNRSLEKANSRTEETLRHLKETQQQLLTAMEEELQAAHDFQIALLPHANPVTPGFDFAGLSIPTNHVGGDHYAYHWLNEERSKLAIIIADVSGKEMKAALTVIRFVETLHYEMQAHRSPAEILAGVNRSLYGRLEPRLFITACIAVLDIPARSLTVATAGHAPVCHRSGSDGRVTELGIYGFPLGIKPYAVYDNTEVKLNAGDILLFYTDGIYEACGSSDVYGFERLHAALFTTDSSKGASQILGSIQRNVEEFMGNTPHEDDLTLVVVKAK